VTPAERDSLHAFLNEQLAEDEATIRGFAAKLVGAMDEGVSGARALRSADDLFEATARRMVCRELLSFHESITPAEVRQEIVDRVLAEARVFGSSTSWAANMRNDYDRLAWSEMHRTFAPLGRMGQWGKL
jgi:hypothetical protein